MRKLYALLLTAALAFCAPAHVLAQESFTSFQDGHSGAYFDDEANGEGLQLNVMGSRDEFFATFYTFDLDNSPIWYAAQGNIAGNVLVGTLVTGLYGTAGEGAGEFITVGRATIQLNNSNGTLLIQLLFDDGRAPFYRMEALTPPLLDVVANNCIVPQFSPADPRCY